MRRWLPMLPLVAAACGGPNPETLLYELRVVAAVADPPEVAVGEPYTLSAVVADPLEEGGEWMIWSCLGDEGCLAERGVLGVDPPTATLLGVAPVPAWVMACAPGACDLAGATEAQLLDPDAWMQSLPLSGVSLASRFTRLTEAAPEDRATNPVITRAPDTDDALPATVAPGRELRLGFDCPGAEAAFGQATAGGFTMVRYDVGDAGNTELVWVAPEDPADVPAADGLVRLYVVFDSGDGGTAVWEASVAVGAP